MAFSYIQNILELQVTNMVLKTPPQISPEQKQDLIELLTEKKLSSIQMISEIMDIDQEVTTTLLKHLLEEGIVTGSLTEDETRFFSSYTKVSSAPTIPSVEADDIVEFEPNSPAGKIAALSGILMLIIGAILRTFTFSGTGMNIEAAGTAVFMVGFPVLIAGWIIISKQNPPDN